MCLYPFREVDEIVDSPREVIGNVVKTQITLVVPLTITYMDPGYSFVINVGKVERC